VVEKKNKLRENEKIGTGLSDEERRRSRPPGIKPLNEGGLEGREGPRKEKNKLEKNVRGVFKGRKGSKIVTGHSKKKHKKGRNRKRKGRKGTGIQVYISKTEVRQGS